MSKYRIIGDVHGKFQGYESIIADCDNSIQVGDFGLGFGRPEPDVDGNHKFIRGNHDNPASCKAHRNWIPDGTLHDGIFFCIGGASSIDADMRTEGLNWWRDEELSYIEFQKIIEDYERIKPDYVISHDVPQTVCEMTFRRLIRISDITRNALDTMLQIHKPKFWAYGHWHMDVTTNYEGCVFRCINELSWIDIDV